ncbi:unnamed protein product [Chironomus riparius]|uniref:Uncharacterized protein n=1 Tax=Chironomus riparius TaxID=315576 RepID=A0A9N9RXP0_9DIPT|nr:unnamed protein product [Chironomus riparius]
MSKENKEDKKTKDDEANQACLDENSFFDLRTKKGQFLFFLITILTSIIVTQLIPLKTSTSECDVKCGNAQELPKPTYWIYGKGGDGQWIHLIKVLNQLGMKRVSEIEMDTADLLWAHDYPFNKLRTRIFEFKSHQKINHFPGCGFLTNKIDLATTNMKYIPKAFRLPEESDKFKKYAEETDKLFVVKHHQHRHIKIQKINEINFSDNETFVQEYIKSPMLIDGHKFDIGVYTIITSIDPLRVYIYYGDILFRYCPQKYHPFDPKVIDKYVVSDDYLPTWEVPALAKYYNSLGYGQKESFDTYVRTHLQKDPQVIWDQVEDAIRLSILTKLPLLKTAIQHYKYKQNFFEMARFDLIIDSDMKVHLIEANMSPNLSSAHFKQNSLLYEQVIYSMLNLVGIGSYLHRESFKKFETEIEAMLSSDKNIMVNGEVCSQLPCSESCSPVECQICKPCLTQSEIIELHRSYREHLNKGDTKRIFPVPINDPKASIDTKFYRNLSASNQLITKWFYHKCVNDRSWCH